MQNTGLRILNLQAGSYLAWPEEVDVDIGIPGHRVDAILAEVFAHVLRGGLRQQPINAFPATTYNRVFTAVTRTKSLDKTAKQASQMNLSNQIPSTQGLHGPSPGKGREGRAGAV